MNINYYTLCWGDYYLQSFCKYIFKKFFFKKTKNFNRFRHNVYYTDKKKSKLKKTKQFLLKKNINLHFIDFSKEISLVKINERLYKK